MIPTSPEFELRDGPSFGLKKRYNQVLVITKDTMTLAMNGETKEARDTEDFMGSAPEFAGTNIFQFTTQGAKEIIELEITQPLPIDMNLIAIFGRVEISA